MERRRRGRLRHQEEALAAHVAELKTDLSSCKDTRTAAKLASSLGGVKSPEEYARDRQRVLQSLLQVDCGRRLSVHCEVMAEECAMCSKPAYTPNNLPSILHQFYQERVADLVQLKHLLLVRWTRFASTDSKLAEELYGPFQQRMEYLMFEYNDSLHRARRLAAASHDLPKKTAPTVTINSDDVMVYLRWLVTHQCNTRTLSSFITNVGWLPALYRSEFLSVGESASSSPSIKEGKKPVATPSSTKWLNVQRDHTLGTPRTTTSHTLTSDHTHLRSFIGRHDNSNLSRDHMTDSDIITHSTMVSSLGGGSGRMGGASSSVGVVSTSLPLHSTRVEDIREKMQLLMVGYGIRGSPSSSEELQIFYEVSRKFQSLLPHQVPRPSPYDSVPTSSDRESKRGCGKVGGVFTKPANWVQFRELTPEPDPVQIIGYSRIRDSTKDIDPLLSLSSLTSHLHTPQRAMKVLRQHAVTVKHPSTLPPLSSSSHLTSSSSLHLVWKSLYLGLDNRNPLESEQFDSMETDTPDYGESPDPTMSVREATQVMSNEKGRGISTKATSVAKDTYLSFLLLRHLHIRDQRTACLSVLNYFRSVERTLTINHRGLSMESGQEQPTAGGSLATHCHLHNTPADYIVSEVKFMQFSEVENHDDFYQFHTTSETGTGLVSVCDPQGVCILYDEALEDLQQLERELLVIGTYYIMSGRGLKEKAGDKDTSVYGRRDVDRMAVLHDLWTSEARYQDNKMKLVNCYLEVYHNTSNRKERERLSKTILTLMKSRPRYDPDSAYFTATFDLESCILESHQQLVRSVVEVVVEEERLHGQQLWEGRDQKAAGSERVVGVGLPPPPPSHPVSLTGHTLLLPPSSLLDSTPSLSLLSSLPHSLQLALSQLSRPHEATPTQLLLLHQKLLEVALEEWEGHRDLAAAGFTNDVIQNVFCGGCADDANMMYGVGDMWIREKEEESGKTRALQLKALCDILQLVSVRHHLLLTSSETSLLTRIYKQLLVSLGHDECHAHLRCVTFDPATAKTQTDKPLELFISKLKESNLTTILDRYVPGQSGLAVGELDDKQLTSFGFRSPDTILELLRSPTGLLRLQTALKTQVAHKWCLATSSLLNCFTLSALEGAARGPNIGGGGGPVTRKLPEPPVSVGKIATTTSDMGRALSVKKTLQKAFVSVQLEKVAVRDHMLTGLLSRFHSTGKTRNGMETAKCEAVEKFCGDLVRVMSLHSLRYQLLQLFQSLLSLLNLFPATRDGYFTVGQMSTAPKPVPPHVKDPRSALSRPPLLLSEDGSKIRNLWYIPHTTEVLTMFSDGGLDDRISHLKTVLSVVSPLLMYLQYHVAYVRLGGQVGGRRRRERETWLGGDWGGTEGIGNVVQRLQNEIAELPDPSDPHQVSEHLQMKCSILYYQHSLTLQHYLQRTFLLHGNLSGVEKLRFTSIPTLTHLSFSSPSPLPAYLPLPLPSPSTDQSDDGWKELPWQHFLSRCGPAPSLPDQLPWEMVDVVMSGLAALSINERLTANGEMLGLSLTLEELATSQTGQTSLSGSSSAHDRSDETTPPVAQAKLMVEFLRLSLQLEKLRWVWSLQVLGGASSISTQLEARQTDHAFRERVVGVARREVARQQMMLDQTKLSMEGDILEESMSHSNTFMTEGGVSGGGANSEPFSAEQLENVSESKLRRAQVVRLLELLELGLIQDTVNHVSQFHHLVMLEQNRDSTTLPLDLWKMSPSMKEPAGVPRPHIVDSFLSRFHSNSTDTGPAYTISKSELRECVYQLSSDVLHREKETFQIYAGHYESLVRSLYSQLYQRDRQMDMWRKRAESVARDNHTTALVTAGELTHSSLLELTGLRVRVRELENQLQTQESQLRRAIQLEYSSLSHSLLSSCTAIAARYHDYRSSLFSDVLHCVSEVREGVAEGVARAKETHSGPAHLGVDVTMTLRGEEECKVQSENAKLNNLLLKQRAMNHLQRSIREREKEREVERWREEWEGVRRGGLEEKMVTEVEIRSLRAQVNSLQKRLGEVEKERDSAVTDLRETRETVPASTAAAKSTDNKTQLQMTQKSKAVSTKMKKLAGELEEKDKKIGELENAWEKQHRQEEEGQKRLSHKLHVAKQQLEHERQLKREAFHQVDDLLTQVHDLESQHHPSLRTLHSRRHSTTPSTPHTLPGSHAHSSSHHTLTGLRPHTSSGHHTRHHTHTTSSAPQSRPSSQQQSRRLRPKSQQGPGRPSTISTSSTHNSSQMIDISHDILALKLI